MDLKQMVRAKLVETNVAIGVASGAVVAADPLRLALWLPSSPTADLTYSTQNPAVINLGIWIPKTGQGLWLDFATHGPAVTAAWFGIASAAVAAGINVQTVVRAE